jgi:hypothetical protein
MVECNNKNHRIRVEILKPFCTSANIIGGRLFFGSLPPALPALSIFLALVFLYNSPKP